MNFVTQFICINLVNWPGLLLYMVPFAAMSLGAIDVCIACYVNERYGPNQFAVIFGSILSLGCVGNVVSELFLYEEIFP